eukprot:Skav226249  [mRNA]  locus=scaffold2708:28881:29686:- [translate_table: standard]
MLGPATNLARALRRAPWLAGHLNSAVLMGGELTGRRRSESRKMQLSSSCCAAKDAAADMADACFGESTRACGHGRCEHLEAVGSSWGSSLLELLSDEMC